ncbi:MAG: 30S ribosome-binding factor RbfA [Clostridia bacterium]|nr:30S ribosome-binding factor RbfA [Clostridia bacterium]MBR5769567.1 30S ribosome-binding factor RbfA [Clostridia bacterium]
MASHAFRNTSENIKRELDSIFKEVKKPELDGKFISIARLEMSKDMAVAKVYISTLSGMDKTEKVVSALKAAKGFIRGELSRRLDLRHTPELVFIPDDSMEYGARISKLIEDGLNGDKND